MKPILNLRHVPAFRCDSLLILCKSFILDNLVIHLLDVGGAAQLLKCRQHWPHQFVVLRNLWSHVTDAATPSAVEASSSEWILNHAPALAAFVNSPRRFGLNLLIRSAYLGK